MSSASAMKREGVDYEDRADTMLRSIVISLRYPDISIAEAFQRYSSLENGELKAVQIRELRSSCTIDRSAVNLGEVFHTPNH